MVGDFAMFIPMSKVSNAVRGWRAQISEGASRKSYCSRLLCDASVFRVEAQGYLQIFISLGALPSLSLSFVEREVR